MFIWSMVLFSLGALAVLDSQLNYGYLFRSANSLLFMLVSLGLLIRTRVLVKLGYKEKLLQTNRDLEARISELTRPRSASDRVESESVVNR